MFSEDLKVRIRQQYAQFGSYRKVARLNTVSYTTVKNIVLNLYKSEKKRPGPKPKITNRQERAIGRQALKLISQNSQVTSRKLQLTCALNHVNKRTIQRKLLTMDFVCKEAMNKIVLTEQHKRDRLELARQFLSSPPDWFKVVFTDEKRFNGDGPDSWRSYMPKNMPLIRNRRQQGGPSVQVWGMLIPGPFFFVFPLSQRGTSVDFLDFIEHEVLPLLTQLVPSDYIFQQDLASTHTSQYAYDKFAELGVNLLPWASRSPDLNIIENVWSWLVRKIYDGKQFERESDIWPAIDAAVTDLNTNHQDYLLKLFESIPRRLLECVELKGDLTHY